MTTEPRTLQEAIIYFADPDNCLNYLAAKRWPNGVDCPHCQSKNVSFVSNRRVWQCKGCRKQFSAKVGTIAVGKQADLVVIDGNPAARAADIRNVRMVFQDGSGYDPQKLLDSIRGSVSLH